MKAKMVLGQNQTSIRRKKRNDVLVSTSAVRASSAKLSKNKIEELKKNIAALEEQKRVMLQTESNLIGAMQTSSQRKQLFKEFQADIAAINGRLQIRSNMLDLYSDQLSVFRQEVKLAKNPEEFHYQLARAHEESLHMSQKELLIENQKLVEQALAQERLLLVNKMKLRLCHDHRDLTELRTVLNKLMGGGKSDDEDQYITTKLKEMIGGIKKHIAEEKKRIEFLLLPIKEENEAAISIQSAWRRYVTREKFKKLKEELINEANEEDDGNDETQSTEETKSAEGAKLAEEEKPEEPQHSS